MYPADPLEALRCDEILMTLEDATTVILPSMRESVCGLCELRRAFPRMPQAPPDAGVGTCLTLLCYLG